LKLKKDKAERGKGKDHFRTRWDRVTALGQASYDEAMTLVPYFGGSTQAAGLQYEQQKHKRLTGNQQPTLKGLGGAYANERKLWLASNKTTAPVSATTVH